MVLVDRFTLQEELPTYALQCVSSLEHTYYHATHERQIESPNAGRARKCSESYLIRRTPLPIVSYDEVTALRCISHRCIVPCFDIFVDDHFAYLVFPDLKSSHTLLDSLTVTYSNVNSAMGKSASISNPLVLTEEAVLQYMHDIASALCIVHAHNIAHRNVRLETVRLDPHIGTAMLSDFQNSVLLQSESGLISTHAPTSLKDSGNSPTSPLYMSPEILTASAYDPRKADIWSFGIICFALLTGSAPFGEAEATNDILHQIVHSDVQRYVYETRFSPNDVVNQSFRSLLASMLHRDPNKRCTAKDILTHPLLSDFPHETYPQIPFLVKMTKDSLRHVAHVSEHHADHQGNTGLPGIRQSGNGVESIVMTTPARGGTGGVPATAPTQLPSLNTSNGYNNNNNSSSMVNVGALPLECVYRKTLQTRYAARLPRAVLDTDPVTLMSSDGASDFPIAINVNGVRTLINGTNQQTSVTARVDSKMICVRIRWRTDDHGVANVYVDGFGRIGRVGFVPKKRNPPPKKCEWFHVIEGDNVVVPFMMTFVVVFE
eukprot:PhF_6_TR32134/c0_g1_i2/m.47579/K08796/BRSK; BR serine/threonine kinase